MNADERANREKKWWTAVECSVFRNCFVGAYVSSFSICQYNRISGITFSLQWMHIFSHSSIHEPGCMRERFSVKGGLFAVAHIPRNMAIFGRVPLDELLRHKKKFFSADFCQLLIIVVTRFLRKYFHKSVCCCYCFWPEILWFKFLLVLAFSLSLSLFYHKCYITSGLQY